MWLSCITFICLFISANSLFWPSSFRRGFSLRSNVLLGLLLLLSPDSLLLDLLPALLGLLLYVLLLAGLLDLVLLLAGLLDLDLRLTGVLVLVLPLSGLPVLPLLAGLLLLPPLPGLLLARLMLLPLASLPAPPLLSLLAPLLLLRLTRSSWSLCAFLRTLSRSFTTLSLSSILLLASLSFLFSQGSCSFLPSPDSSWPCSCSSPWSPSLLLHFSPSLLSYSCSA